MFAAQGLEAAENDGNETAIPLAVQGTMGNAYTVSESAGFFKIWNEPPKLKLPAFNSIGSFASLLKENRAPNEVSDRSIFSEKTVSGILYAAFNSKSLNKNCTPRFAE